MSLSTKKESPPFQVFQTFDYDAYDPYNNQLLGNRTPDRSHVRKIKESMEKNYYPTIIQVNEQNQIIDGQHRFLAIKELGLPMYKS
jgi:ParB-like chromosome segregation protein Spo0J